MMSLLITLLSLSFQAQANPFSTPKLITRYMAKEYCSCRFVVKQSQTVCAEENKTLPLVFVILEDTGKKSVTIRSGINVGRARFINERYGCQLDLK